MKVEIRSAGEAVISGYVNAVERDSRTLPKMMAANAKGNFVERIRAKTFEKALGKAKNIELRFNHEKIIGSTTDGSLKLKEDNIGLFAEATIHDKEVISEARNLKGWSFGFTKNHDEWEDVSPEVQRRNIDDIELKEVSILTLTPAYVGTSIEMRGEETAVSEERGFEENFEISETEEPQKVDFSNQKRAIEILKIKGE